MPKTDILGKSKMEMDYPTTNHLNQAPPASRMKKQDASSRIDFFSQTSEGYWPSLDDTPKSGWLSWKWHAQGTLE